MESIINCLIDREGKVYASEGRESPSEIAAHFGLDVAQCEPCQYDLERRRLVAAGATVRAAQAAESFVNQTIGTPERLVAFARAGHLDKQALEQLLDPESRGSFRHACAAIEDRLSLECQKGEPCLASGCAIDHASGETCLQPVLRADADYRKQCAAEWEKLFNVPSNRIDAWKH